MTDPLREIIARNRAGEGVFVASVCSAHPDVIRIALARAAERGCPVVIEATSNQVNQDGGYTGMTPEGFAAYVRDRAREAGADPGGVILGGDHLGPQAWRRQEAEAAMAKAEVMVADYVRAGFDKIHLDCSEGCKGEPAQLPDTVTAARAARLARVCRDAATDPARLLFVVGTEVPPPGGARADEDGDIPPTRAAAAAATLEAHRDAFEEAGIGDMVENIAGLVVQPGVEFSPMQVHVLPMDRDPGLLAALEGWPGVTLEAHSTDYQPAEVFPRLGALGFGFQKVGPGLTFAWRKAVYALDSLRGFAGWGDGDETVPGAMERLMLEDPSGWDGHYHGDANARRIARHFGLADRIRYYWARPQARRAVARLFADLDGRDLPLPLLAQVFDPEVIARAAALGRPDAASLVRAEVERALDPYLVEGAA